MLPSCSQKITTDIIQRDFTKPKQNPYQYRRHLILVVLDGIPYECYPYTSTDGTFTPYPDPNPAQTSPLVGAVAVDNSESSPKEDKSKEERQNDTTNGQNMPTLNMN
jgi:hypothetical protein